MSPDRFERIEHFSFWQPVVFTLADNPGETTLSKWGYYIGSLADQFATLSQTTLHVNAERIDARKIYFEQEDTKNTPLAFTALKVGLTVFSCGALLILALGVKMIFKNHLNTCRALTKKSPNEIISEKQIGNTKIVLLYGSITDETTDAIVNAAMGPLRAGGGVCGAIHNASGDEPFDECQDILTAQGVKFIDCGETALTQAGDLAPRIKAIVHAVGPDYNDKYEEANGAKFLANAYRNSLEIAHEPEKHAPYVSNDFQKQARSLHSISFVSISTGIFKAPLDEAAPIALNTIKGFIEENPDAFEEVRFVFLPLAKDPNTAPAYIAALKDL